MTTRDELQALSDAATPGKWSSDDKHSLMPGATPAWCISQMGPNGEYVSDIAYFPQAWGKERPDSDFITALVNAFRAGEL